MVASVLTASVVHCVLVGALAAPPVASEGADREPTPASHGLLTTAWADGTVRVETRPDGGPVAEAATVDARSHRVPPGQYVVVIGRPGYVPVRSPVAVPVGGSIVLSAELTRIDANTDGEVWSMVALGVGLAMVTTAGIIEVASSDAPVEVQNAEIVLLSVGSAAFVTGGALALWLHGRNEDPQPVDRSITVTSSGLSPTPDGRGAVLHLGGRF